MAAIDLIVLGMLKDSDLSAYNIQKLVEYRNISKWVKVSTPSIYKKVIQLEEKGLIQGHTIKEGKMPEKAIYSLTDSGEREFEKLMLDISAEPIHIFLDFNAVIVNLYKLSPVNRAECIKRIRDNISGLKAYLSENASQKENVPDIPETGLAVLRQQMVLAEAIEAWLASLKD